MKQWWITCNCTCFTKLISSNEILSIGIQCSEFTALSKWLLPHRFAQFCIVCIVRGYWPRLGDRSYFAHQVWSHPVIYVSKRCLHTGDILRIWNLFRRSQPFTGRPEPAARRLVHRIILFTVTSSPVLWITWPLLWPSSHFPSHEIFIAPE